MIDATDFLQRFYAAALPAELVTGATIPSPRPARFLRLLRVGGPALNRAVDRPLFSVEAWAGTEGSALELAQAARDAALEGLSGRHADPAAVVHRVEEAAGPGVLPDPTTGQSRSVFQISFTIRAA